MSCHDDPTAPQMNPIGIDDGPRRVDDPTFGLLNSNDVGTYDGIINPVWGSAPAVTIGSFPTPTIILVSVAGVVNQAGDAYPTPTPPGMWGPLGVGTDHSGAMGFQVAYLGGSSNFWPTTVTDFPVLMGGNTFILGFRADITGAQPEGSPTRCGWGREPPLWCYRYTGTAKLTFVSTERAVDAQPRWHGNGQRGRHGDGHCRHLAGDDRRARHADD